MLNKIDGKFGNRHFTHTTQNTFHRYAYTLLQQFPPPTTKIATKLQHA